MIFQHGKNDVSGRRVVGVVMEDARKKALEDARLQRHAARRGIPQSDKPPESLSEAREQAATVKAILFHLRQIDDMEKRTFHNTHTSRPLQEALDYYEIKETGLASCLFRFEMMKKTKTLENKV